MLWTAMMCKSSTEVTNNSLRQKKFYTCVSWERLSDLNESNPVKADEYVVSKNVHVYPAFVWWVLYLLNNELLLGR
jgi:hypothetical protein